jgi:putative oxidoreductase
MRGLLYTAARVALACVFVRAGWDVLQKPETAAKKAGPLLSSVRSAAPASLPEDEMLVRANAGVQVVGGLALAAGVAPRLAAGALIGSLVPTTYAGHPFWMLEDPAERTQQRNHFNKNLGLAGGLLLVVLTGARRG